jgi:hypothetical protein
MENNDFEIKTNPIDMSLDIKDIIKALSNAQAEFPPIPKTQTNPYYKKKYADLSTIIHNIKNVMNKNGLAFTQTIIPNNDSVIVKTTLFHISGQFINSTISVKLEGKKDPQALGSAITYLRRYSLSAIIGVASEDDDDGNATKINGITKEDYKPAKKTEDNPYQIIKNAKTITELENSAKEIFKTNPDLKSSAVFIGLCKTQRTALEEKKAEEMVIDDIVSEDVPFPDNEQGKKFNQKTFDRIKTTTGKIEYYETLSKGEQVKYSKLFEPYYNEMEGKDNE